MALEVSEVTGFWGSLSQDVNRFWGTWVWGILGLGVAESGVTGSGGTWV